MNHDHHPFSPFQTHEPSWFVVDSEMDVVNEQIVGTFNPTDHMILMEMHFEPVYGNLIHQKLLFNEACFLDLQNISWRMSKSSA